MLILECRKCKGHEMYLQQKGMQVGAYCKNCGSWVKWVGKKELPIYQSRGAKIYPEGMEIVLNQQENLGVGLPTPLESSNIGVTIEKYKQESANDSISTTNEGHNLISQYNIDDSEKRVQAEVERRVQEELSKIKEIDGEEGDEYCPICAGLPIELEEKSKVDMVLYSDVLTITDISGVQVLGFWRIKHCPNCGKKLN